MSDDKVKYGDGDDRFITFDREWFIRVEKEAAAADKLTERQVRDWWTSHEVKVSA